MFYNVVIYERGIFQKFVYARQYEVIINIIITI